MPTYSTTKISSNDRGNTTKKDSSRAAAGEDEDAARDSSATKSILGQLVFGLAEGSSSQLESAGSAQGHKDEGELDELFASGMGGLKQRAKEQGEEEAVTIGTGKSSKRKKKMKKEKRKAKKTSKSQTK